jgi:hypothetical protein
MVVGALGAAVSACTAVWLEGSWDCAGCCGVLLIICIWASSTGSRDGADLQAAHGSSAGGRR